MKKNKLSMRVGSIILSASMLVSSVTPAMAANVSATDDFPVTEETVETSVTEEAAQDEVTEEETSEETTVSANTTEEVTEEDTLESEGAYNGTPSKVIGVEISESFHTEYLGDHRQQYVYKNSNPAVYLPGTKETLEALKVPNTNYYSYDGNYYSWGGYSETRGYIYLDGKITFIDGDASQCYDQTTGLYKVNGVYYSSLYYVYGATKKIGISAGAEVLPVGIFDSYTKAADTFKVLNGYGNTAYYTKDGRYFEYLESNDTDKGDYYYLCSEIVFDRTYPDISWNALTSSEVTTTSNGEPLKIGYEIEVNGKPFTETSIFASNGNSRIPLLTYSETTLDTTLSAGETVTAKVRGIYYYTKEEEVTDSYGEKEKVTRYYVDKVGAWSDVASYTFDGYQKVATPSNFTATVYDNDTIKLDWNQVVEASGYSVYSIHSKKPIPNLTNKNFDQFYQRYGDDYEKSGLNYEDYATDYDYCDVTQVKQSAYRSYPYHYYVVTVSGVAEGYITDLSYSNVASVVTSQNAYTPQVKNLKVEYNADGSFKIAFDPISDATVYIYAYEKKQFPTNYNINQIDPRAVVTTTDEDGWTDSYTTYLYDNLTSAELTAIGKVYKTYVDGSDGYVDSSDFYGLKTGVTYYFVAHTYDTINADIDRKAYATVDNVAYTRYNDVSPVSNMVSAKKTLYKPSVCTTSATTTSIKLGLTGSNATGFEIYKKSGKKYKKIATTTSNYYVDKDLKANTKYSYKVRSYYYNKDSKVKCYSDYIYVTAETSAAKAIDLTLKEKSQTSVSLAWTKVAGATKYEIYRSNVIDCDHSVLSKKYDDAGDYASYLHSHKYELVKTLTGNKTFYTDKKLKTGETYNYVVMAYYKNGKTTQYISASDSVSLELQVPQNVQTTLKKSSATVTWEKDNYASKYEIQYTIYDAEGVAKTKTAQKASTSKTSYTIKNIPNGGYAYVQVRAYGKNKKYSGWTSTSVTTSLGVTSSIKAANVEKDGKSAVKITWKKVSGAKYYRVFRSTYEGAYNKDEKKYVAETDSYIAKEANDDENDDTVVYDDYYSVYGSIVGTTAYDYALLDSGVTYYYYVVAYGEKGTEIASYVTTEYSKFTLASGKPASVVYNASLKVKLTNSKKGQVKVSYNKVAGVTTYTIYRSEKKNGTYKKLGTSKKTSYTDKKAKKGKTYYYKVVATGTNALKADLNVESAATKIKVKK